ncbi:hypothetical protein, partial [Saccharibacter floricola]|uniref:hypothetical protein n=1 Tax=Saccharibacter floricola TaxID=231053 RepID=UPI00223111F8
SGTITGTNDKGITLANGATAALTGANQYQGDTTVDQNANLTLNGTVGAINNSGTTAFTGTAGNVTNQSGTTTL